MATYKYVGDGMGVPGLPHEVSDEEAEKLGVSELLKEAVESGAYVEVNQDFDRPSNTPRTAKKRS